jgi:hypothetical protein
MLTDHVTLNFSRIISTAAVFLDVEKAFDAAWHLGLLHKLSEVQFSASVIKLISSFLSNRGFKASVYATGNKSRVPQDSALSHLALFAYDACIYAVTSQRRLSSQEAATRRCSSKVVV